jgi:hypothetical protein
VSIVCFKAEASATDRSLAQRSPSECGVSECDRKTSKRSRLRPNRGLSIHEKKYLRKHEGEAFPEQVMKTRGGVGGGGWNFGLPS